MAEKDEVKYEEVGLRSPVLEKLENFWYHYKIHIFVALFVVIILTVVCFQTCSKVSYDAHILYAGPHEIKHNAAGPYQTAVSSFKRVCDDFDGDSATNIALLDLFVINNEEADKLLSENEGMEINATLVAEDTEKLGQTILYGDYYLCFLSERLFKEYEQRYADALFVDITDYTAGLECELASEHGVYLSSLNFSSLPEICNFPSDTVVCLKKLSEVSSLFGKRDSEKSFSRAEAVLKNILAYE